MAQGQMNCLSHCKNVGTIPWHRKYKELDCFEFERDVLVTMYATLKKWIALHIKYVFCSCTELLVRITLS